MRVSIIQFAMAKCPDTTAWTADFNAAIPHAFLEEHVNFTQSYVGGDVGEGPVDETNWMNCFHGESECAGHKTMLCAKELVESTMESAEDFDYSWFNISYA